MTDPCLATSYLPACPASYQGQYLAFLAYRAELAARCQEVQQDLELLELAEDPWSRNSAYHPIASSGPGLLSVALVVSERSWPR